MKVRVVLAEEGAVEAGAAAEGVDEEEEDLKRQKIGSP